MPDDQEYEDKPPYLSFTTFANFFDKMAEGPIPPRLDKSLLERYSGGTQTLLMSALRLMRYVDQYGTVLPALRDSVSDVGERKAYLERWARQFYAEQLKLAEANDTAQKLHESFAERGYSGSTLRKAVVFYLALVDYLGLPNSPYFKPPKQSGTPTSKRRPRPVQPPSTDRTPPPPTFTPASRGETTVVQIDDVATITINVDAQWMKLPVDTITAMRSAIAELEALGTVDDDQEDP